MSTPDAVKAVEAAMAKMEGPHDYAVWIGGKTSKSYQPILDAIKAAGYKSRYSRIGNKTHLGSRRIYKPGSIPNYSVLEDVARPPGKADKAVTTAILNQLAKVYPNTEVVTNMDQISKEVPGFGDRHKGAYYNGKVYLNMEKITADTPLHEFTHMWMNEVAISDRKFFNRGKELFFGSKLARDTKQRYPQLKGDAFWKEVLTNAIGKKGTSLFTDKKKAGTWDRWVKKFGNLVKDFLGIKSPDDYQNLTVDQWLDVAATGVLTGDTQIFSQDTKAKPEFSIEETPETDEDVILAKEKGNQVDYRKVFGVKVPRDFVKWLVPPAADDFHGLISQIGTKGKKLVRDTFVKNHHNYVQKSQKTRNSFKAIRKALGADILNNPTVTHKGVKLTGAQAIQAHIDGFSSPSLDKFINSPKVQKYINSMQDLGVLKQSTGDRNYLSASPDFDLVNYILNDLYTESFQDFNNIKSNIFNQNELNRIRSEKGNKFADALENALQRMSTGKNSQGVMDKTTQKWNDWAQGSVGTIMFFNFRSAALQLLSVGNYGFSDQVNSAKFIGELAKGLARLPFDLANKNSALRKRLNNPYLKERRARAGFDVNMQELADSIQGSRDFSEITKKILNFGFKATSAVDSLAIALGGEAFVKAGGSEKAWIDQTEEAQQSSRPDRVSQWQTTGISKFVLAFANTPAQYFRLGQKAYRTIKDKNATNKQKAAAASKILWYMAAQNALFVALQSASHGVFDEDEEEVKSAYNSMADSILRGMGLYGAVISSLKNVAYEADRQSKKSNPDYITAMLKATSISPPLNRKINDLLAIGRGYQYKSEDKHATAVTRGVAVTTNLPADWAYKKYQAAVNLWSEEYGAWQKFLMFLGYSPYALDKKGGEDTFEDFDFGDADFEDVDFEDVDF